MKGLNWAELKGEGNKLQDFSRAFINEMATYNLEWKDVSTNSNEISLKLVNKPSLKGRFYASNEEGNLHYKTFLKNSIVSLLGIFFGILLLFGGILLIIISAKILFFIDPELATLMVIFGAMNWIYIGAGVAFSISNTIKSKIAQFLLAVKAVEAVICSL